MELLLERRRATVDVIVHTDDPSAQPRVGLRPIDVVCHLKRAGAPEWTAVSLTPATWQDSGHGVYVVTLNPELIAAPGITLHVEGAPDLTPPIAPLLERFAVGPMPRDGVGEMQHTTVIGRIVTLGQVGKAKAPVTVRLAQLPLIIGGAAICNDVLTVETDDDGCFSLSLVTGATVVVQIQAINYQKQFVVPPPQVAGMPLRLFSL